MSTTTISLTVNNKAHTVEVPNHRRLLDVLRDDLGVTGPKEGCGAGECGACTVMLNDEPVNSCMMLGFQAEGGNIVSTEGLGSPDEPSSVQRAIAEGFGSQCGFCSPGIVVSATALLRRNPTPTAEEVREGLAGNICRCTGYQQIVDSIVKLGASGQFGKPVSDRVGKSAFRLNGIENVTGATKYAADIAWPKNLTHGVTVRALVPHAKLLGIDTTAALAVPGVLRVLTAKDVPGALHFGNIVEDQPVFAHDKIRFWGEAVALVIAETIDAAQYAATLVTIDTEALPVVGSAADGLKEDAEQVHEQGNLLVHQKVRKGDFDAVAKTAAHIVTRTYNTQAQEHLALEPEVAFASPDGEGGVVVQAPSQNVFFDRVHVMRALGLERKQVHIIQSPTGAAFGSREDIYAQTHAALGAQILDRPCRIVWTRAESQVATTKRHPATMNYTAALSADGILLGLKIDVIADTGAYSSWAPNISRKMLVHATGPYEVHNVHTDIRMVYTNNGISGAFRGFGAPQVAFAYESFMEELAAEVGLSGVDFRYKNHLGVGKMTATGQTITGSIGLKQCMDEALATAAKMPLDTSNDPDYIKRGRGISSIYYGIGYGNGILDIGSSVVELTANGFNIRTGAIDYGQGLETVFTQIAGEVIGVSRNSLSIMTGDSNETPDSGSSVASRQTYVTGEAVRQASVRLRTALTEYVSEKWGVSGDDVVFQDDGVYANDKMLATLEELYALSSKAGVRIRRQVRFKCKTTKLDLETGQGDAYWPYAFAVHIADVAVNTLTGEVKVTNIIAAHDVGKAINPEMVIGQIVGGAAQGLGFALFEDHIVKDGIPQTLNLDTYRIPSSIDVPPMVPLIIEDPEPTGPFGAKGVGEPVLVAVAPAVANAVADAVGVRVRRLPLLPERIREGLLAKEESSA